MKLEALETIEEQERKINQQNALLGRLIPLEREFKAGLNLSKYIPATKVNTHRESREREGMVSNFSHIVTIWLQRMCVCVRERAESRAEGEIDR